MKNCAFTIVAKNYIGLAQILEKSIRQYYNELDFYIVVADEMDDELRNKVGDNILVAKEILNIEESLWQDMSFKYNLTEFCTSIKPASFRYFFDNYNYNKCIYLDPDICFFDSIGLIYEMLDSCEILLTPHITQISDTKVSDAPENAWLSCGIFNLGFCGLRRGESSSKMINWWHNRLTMGCFIDTYGSFYTDQKWMNFLPSFFTTEQFHATRHLGFNVAPWNFFERKVVVKDEKFLVTPRFGDDKSEFPLIFVHYSGYNYSELKKGSVTQNNIPQLAAYKDILQLTTHYAKEIHSQRDIFDSCITKTYTYNFFENGDTISIAHRRLYRSLVEKGENYPYPFRVDSNTLYSVLKKHKMIITNCDINIDKSTKQNLPGIDRKLRLFNCLTRAIFKLMGYQKYMLLIRLLAPFSRYEAQIHIIDKKFDSNNIY